MSLTKEREQLLPSPAVNTHPKAPGRHFAVVYRGFQSSSFFPFFFYHHVLRAVIF
ncbi:hypothetical protein IF2G_00391 [Cordyceps javanica]|nr:hypothetical protein IF2G_00391 [Cordyceps javanica]